MHSVNIKCNVGSWVDGQRKNKKSNEAFKWQRQMDFLSQLRARTCFFTLNYFFLEILQISLICAISLQWKTLCHFFSCFNPVQDGPFRSCSRMEGWWVGGGEKSPHSLTSITHMLQWWNLIPYLKKIQKLYKSRDTQFEFC